MPLVNPIISKVVPVKIGGTPIAGVGRLASAFDHVHGLVETAGPTNLTPGSWLDGEMARRVGSLIAGRLMTFPRLTAGVSSTLATAGDVSPQLTVALKTGTTYFFAWFVVFRTANATTGLRLAINYSGTASYMRCVLLGATGAAGFQASETSTLDGLIGVSAVGPGATDLGCILSGTIITTSAGTMALRFASGVAGSSVSVQSGTTGMIVEL
jgi:hypothetical protein